MIQLTDIQGQLSRSINRLSCGYDHSQLRNFELLCLILIAYASLTYQRSKWSSSMNLDCSIPWRLNTSLA